MEENTSKVYLEPADALLRQQSGAGSPLFVINLCASMAPMAITGGTLPGLEAYRLYTVARVEDGRTRYRLRMGFFTSKEAADDVATVVRKEYATAFTACLSDEDRKYMRGYVPDASMTARTRARLAVSMVPQMPPPAPAARQPVKQAAPQVTARTATPASPPAKSASVAPSRAAANVPAARAASPAAPTARSAAPAMPPQAAPARQAHAPQARPVDAAASGTFEVTWQPPPRVPASSAPRTDATGSFKAATGSHKALATGSHKALDRSSFDEIEISWERPAAKVPQAHAPAQAAASKPAAPKASAPVAKPAAPVAAPKVPPTIKAEPAAQAKPAVKAQPPVVKAPPAPAPKPPAKAIPEVKHPPVTVKPSAPVRLELEAAPIVPKHVAPSTPSNQPFHVGKGVNIPQVSFSLQHEPAAAKSKQAGDTSSRLPKLSPTAAVAKQTGDTSSRLPKLSPAAAAAKQTGDTSSRLPKLSPAAAAAVQKPSATKVAMPPKGAMHAPAGHAPQLPPRIAGLPDLDSTQTIRALTSEELNDAHQEKWFSIQLAVSEQPVNLDAMPHLDIFEAYRLYSVATAGSGKIVHSLRLGFFREAVSAEAVSGYLKTFFPSPLVMRISTAEQLRFKDAPVPKAMLKNESKVIDLNDARDRAKPVPMVTMEVAHAADRSSASGSFKAGAAASKNGSSGMYKALPPALNKPVQAAAVKPRAPAAKSTKVAPKRPEANKPAGSQTGKYRVAPKLSLQDQLLEEAREVELSESGIRRLPKNDSLLARLVDKLKK